MALELLITDATNMQPGEIKKIISVLQVLAEDALVHPTIPTQKISEIHNIIGESVNFNYSRSQEINEQAGKPDADLIPDPPVVPVPLTPEQAFAPSTAAADPLPTAPVDTTATISTPNASAPQPPAPPAPPLAAPTAGADTPNPVETDSDGLAWDRRIHSEGKTKIANGTWRLKKGVSDDTIRMVKAEQAAASAGVTVESFEMPTAPQPPVTPVAPPANTAPTPPSPPAVPTSDTPRSWLQTVQRTVDGVKVGKYTAEDLGGLLLSEFGVPSVAALNGPANVDKLAALNAVLDQWEAK